MKDCMFQYATKQVTIKDSCLITRQEAESLWKSCKENFIKRHRNEEEPEMCIWINCKNDSDYHTNILHVDSDNVCRDGDIYEYRKVLV